MPKSTAKTWSKCWHKMFLLFFQILTGPSKDTSVLESQLDRTCWLTCVNLHFKTYERIAHLLSQTSFFLSLLLVCFPLSCFVVPFLVLFLCFSFWVFFSWILVRGNANANANAHSIITCKIKTRRSHSKIKRTSFRSSDRSQFKPHEIKERWSKLLFFMIIS